MHGRFFKYLRATLRDINAWQIRIIALACLVITIGGGSQTLVNVFAASTEAKVEWSTPIHSLQKMSGDSVRIPATTHPGDSLFETCLLYRVSSPITQGSEHSSGNSHVVRYCMKSGVRKTNAGK